MVLYVSFLPRNSPQQQVGLAYMEAQTGGMSASVESHDYDDVCQGQANIR